MKKIKIIKRNILTVGLILALGTGLIIHTLAAEESKSTPGATSQGAVTGANGKITLKPNARERKIPLSDATSVWSYYGVTPESPNEKRLCYVLYPKPIGLDSEKQYPVNPAQLWVCNIDGTGHRMLFKGSGSVHDGLSQSWVDDKHIVFVNDGATRIINADTGEIEFGPWQGFRSGHEAKNGKVLLKRISNLAFNKQKLWEFDMATQKMRLVLPYKRGIAHAQYSPDGQKALFTTDRNTHLVVVNLDGSGLKVFSGKKPMHFQWFDNQSFFGYVEGGVVGVNPNKHRKHEMYRWNLDGRIIEYLAGHGCHGAVRKDGKYFVGESWYKSNPIKLWLYARGSREPLHTIFSHPFKRVTWHDGGRHHVNPSFSRDGMRLYYNKAVNENTSQAFSYDLTGLVSPVE